MTGRKSIETVALFQRGEYNLIGSGDGFGYECLDDYPDSVGLIFLDYGDGQSGLGTGDGESRHWRRTSET